MTQDFGTVTFEGKTYTLTQQAYCDNVGTDGEVSYFAHAEDAEGNTFKVVWETTLEWDEAGELYNLELKQEQQPYDFDTEDQERMDELEAKDVQSYLIQDESDACDWENPVDVYEV